MEHWKWYVEEKKKEGGRGIFELRNLLTPLPRSVRVLYLDDEHVPLFNAGNNGLGHDKGRNLVICLNGTLFVGRTSIPYMGHEQVP